MRFGSYVLKGILYECTAKDNGHTSVLVTMQREIDNDCFSALMEDT